MMTLLDVTLPLSQDFPVGQDLRVSAPERYYALKTLRTDLRDEERQNFQLAPAHLQPRWQKVHDLCIEILSQHSKDSEILAFWIEASLRAQGFAGLAFALEASTKIVKQYWDQLHPQDLEDKILPFTSLNGLEKKGSLAVAIYQQNLTEEPCFAFWEYQKDPKTQNPEIHSAAANTPLSFYQNLLSALEQAQAAYTHFCQSLEDRCPPVSLPTAFIHQSLIDCQESLRSLLQASPHASLLGKSTAATLSSPLPNLPVTDRDLALNKIAELSAYFKRTEPNSPLAALLNRCVNFGRLSWAELLSEIIKDDRSREEVLNVTGK